MFARSGRHELQNQQHKRVPWRKVEWIKRKEEVVTLYSIHETAVKKKSAKRDEKYAWLIAINTFNQRYFSFFLVHCTPLLFFLKNSPQSLVQIAFYDKVLQRMML